MFFLFLFFSVLVLVLVFRLRRFRARRGSWRRPIDDEDEDDCLKKKDVIVAVNGGVSFTWCMVLIS